VYDAVIAATESGAQAAEARAWVRTHLADPNRAITAVGATTLSPRSQAGSPCDPGLTRVVRWTKRSIIWSGGTRGQRAEGTYHNVLGLTAGGRLLLVVWVDDPRGRYPVHSRQAGRSLARRYYE
jgi:hypothetical protein